jgi:hypothetical protein
LQFPLFPQTPEKVPKSIQNASKIIPKWSKMAPKGRLETPLRKPLKRDAQMLQNKPVLAWEREARFN